MVKSGLAWSPTDLEAATSLLSEYAIQAGKLLSPHDESKARKLAGLFRSGRLGAGTELTSQEEGCTFMVLSPGQRWAYLHFEARTEEFDGIVRYLNSLKNTAHGDRPTRVKLSDPLSFNVSGRSRRGRRWEISLNGTTQPYIADMGKKFSIAIDPAILRRLDLEHDDLLRSARAAFLRQQPTERGDRWYAVFDLDAKDAAFSDEMKTRLHGQFTCDKQDDWNWAVPLTRRTLPEISNIISKFRFSTDRRLQNFLASVQSDNAPKR